MERIEEIRKWAFSPSKGKESIVFVRYLLKCIDRRDIKIKQISKALLDISGVVSEAWGDFDGELPAGIQIIFDALEQLDKDCPDWNR
jgi:hypothetical protein